jgi:hypothetical protein
MDDARIRELTTEVLSQLQGAEKTPPSNLETRLAALEAEVRALRAALQPSRTVTSPATCTSQAQAVTHPSLQALDVKKGTEHCVLEPDKPCVGSGQCRTLGY